MKRSARRTFLTTSLAAIASTKTRAQSTPRTTAQSTDRTTSVQATKPQVVVIGGGAGGATAASLIAHNTNGLVDVTLVDMNPTYQSCFFSNHYLAGLRDFGSLTHGYSELQSKLNVRIIIDRAREIDRVAQTVEMENETLRYDILVLAPGIDFVKDSVNGWSESSENLMPHAYKGGEQIRLLKDQITAMPQGGVFAIVPPAGKYRCPPGPYERVCVVAHLLKTTNPTAKIIIADPKPVFSKMGLFREAWKKYYKGMIDMNSDVDLSTATVDPKAMTIKLDGEVIKVDVCNVIPGQQAGVIAQIAGITENGWAPVHAQDMRSRLDENVYVIGDAAEQGEMPKSAFSAHSQAKVCADAIVGRLTGSAIAVPRFKNTCWSFVAKDNSVKIGATYEATEQGIAKVDGFVSRRKEDAATRKKTFEESLDWYASITQDMFRANG